MPSTKETKKVVMPRQSVHVVFFSCPNCGEETEHIQFCPDCGKPMRVIDVVEKFGDEADEFLKSIKTKLEDGDLSPNDYITAKDDESPNIIVLGEDEHINDDDAVTDDTSTLDDIFPDDDENTTSSAPEALTDLDDIVAELDKEEDDDFSLDSLDDIGEEGLPEL